MDSHHPSFPEFEQHIRHSEILAIKQLHYNHPPEQSAKYLSNPPVVWVFIILHVYLCLFVREACMHWHACVCMCVCVPLHIRKHLQLSKLTIPSREGCWPR